MAKHFDADFLTTRAADVFAFDEIGNFFHLFQFQFARQHHHIGKGRVETKRLFVRNVELGGEMHLLSDGSAIAEHRYVGRDDRRDVCCLGGVADFAHQGKILSVDDRVDREIALHAEFIAALCDFMEVFDGESAGRMRAHVERFDAEIDGVSSGLECRGERFARTHGSHHFILHSCRVCLYSCCRQAFSVRRMRAAAFC